MNLKALLLLALIPAGSWADVFRTGEFRLALQEPVGEYRLTAQIPLAVADALDLVYPEGCSQRKLQQSPIGRNLQLTYDFQCQRSLRGEDSIKTPWRLDAARLISSVGLEPSSITLQRSPGGMVIPLLIGPRPDRPVAELAPEFLWQGMLHIWFGWDHLAFVLCLCLLSRGYPLLGLITAFTLGHSLSLGLAFFDVVSVAITPIEAIIALSIVLVARQALLITENSVYGPASAQPAISRELVVVIGFGLIHGLGFASALGELGVSPGERWPALIFFNLGVEAGQLIFVALVVALFSLLPAGKLSYGLRSSLLYSAGIVACFWSVERIVSFPWS